MAISQWSIIINLDDQQTLHLRRISDEDQQGPIVFFIHGHPITKS